MQMHKISEVLLWVIFFQSDNGMVPVFSVPRNLIAENPFTSLLLCSRLPSNATDTETSVLSWCQLVTVEVAISIYSWMNMLSYSCYTRSWDF